MKPIIVWPKSINSEWPGSRSIISSSGSAVLFLPILKWIARSPDQIFISLRRRLRSSNQFERKVILWRSVSLLFYLWISLKDAQRLCQTHRFEYSHARNAKTHRGYGVCDNRKAGNESIIRLIYLSPLLTAHFFPGQTFGINLLAILFKISAMIWWDHCFL